MGSALSTAAATAAAGADRLIPSMLPKSFTVVMVGLDGAGKTSIVNRLKRRELPMGVLAETIPTIGSTLETIPYGRHSVTVWEFGGIEKVRPLWRRYFWNAHAFVFALDAATPDRFGEAKDELHRMYEGTGERFPLLVLANKTDLEGAADLDTISRALDIDALSKSQPGRVVAVKGISAMTGEGMDEALEWLTANVLYELIVQHNGDKGNVVQAW